MPDKRSFQVLKLVSASGGTKSTKCGTYVSTSPAGAAKKAFSRECRQSSIHGVCALDVYLVEKGTDKKYSYHVSREKLKTPSVRTINGKEIVNRFTVKAKSLRSKK